MPLVALKSLLIFFIQKRAKRAVFFIQRPLRFFEIVNFGRFMYKLRVGHLARWCLLLLLYLFIDAEDPKATADLTDQEFL
jgi:hypothetical protein